jgi:ATP-dependent Clp protease ATP-binding subunit ClpA
MHANQKKHQYITVEHLLLSLLDNPDTIEILLAFNVNINRLRDSLSKHIDTDSKKLSAKSKAETQPRIDFQRVMQRAIFQVQSSGQFEVNGGNVLISIFNEPNSQACILLNQEGITRLDAINYLINKKNSSSLQNNDMQISSKNITQDIDLENENEFPQNDSLLERFTTNMNRKVKENKIDPIIGREVELKRAMQILSRRSKNNTLLVGEPGVGKTAIVEGLARAITMGNVPEKIKGYTIFTMDLGMLLAGTKYRGDFEKRFKLLLKELINFKNGILFIDEIHTLVGAGAASGGTLDAANLLKPILSRGEVRCIGATTYHEFRNLFSKDRALLRRFQKVDVKEPSKQETLDILKGIKTQYEEHHKITYTLSSLRTAIDLSSRYITDRYLPDKAIDIIDEAGAKYNLYHKDPSGKKVSKSDIEAIVCKMAQIPKRQISSNDKNMLINLGKNIKQVIFGQDHVIDKICATIICAKAGLNNLQKPIGSFLFLGPTGTGKTELCLQLSKNLGLPLLRFDMSEFMEKHTSSQLVGAPAGYVGYDQGGQLTDKVMKHPHCILLLDEIEKAHPDILNLLLQIMDNGSLNDNLGRKIDFRHTILIMTSNIGGEEMSKNPMGFNSSAQTKSGLEAMKKFFKPEFRNRLTDSLQFNHLNDTLVLKIVDKFLIQLELKLEEKNITLDVTTKARILLKEKGFDPTLGARPLERIIEENIQRKLSEMIILGKIKRGDTVKISTLNNNIQTTVKNNPKLTMLPGKKSISKKVGQVVATKKSKRTKDKDAA